MLANMRDQELEIGRRDGIVVLVWFEKEWRAVIRIVVSCTENEYTSKQFYGQGINTSGSVREVVHWCVVLIVRTRLSGLK